jgi:hypothetical protein
VGGDFQPAAAKFRELRQQLALLIERGGVAFGSGRIVLLQIFEDGFQVGFRLR